MLCWKSSSNDSPPGGSAHALVLLWIFAAVSLLPCVTIAKGEAAVERGAAEFLRPLGPAVDGRARGTGSPDPLSGGMFANGFRMGMPPKELLLLCDGPPEPESDDEGGNTSASEAADSDAIW